MEQKNYESIIDKLRKVLALRDAGFTGEASAAEAALNRLCRKYGITINEILDSGEKKKDVYFNGLSDNLIKDILFACYFKVTKQQRVSYGIRGRSCIVFELTAAQEVELKELFNCMKSAYKKGVKQMMADYKDAFIIKNKLFSDGTAQGPKDPLSPQEYDRLMRIFTISMGIDPTPIPRKMIETR